ncbi:hypothetical protein BTZ20_3731 [Rhodococcus sp. MTM3W5.2]|nr:hypothetical protein BTZ20_3731 [Rhodococcus sp. MTM3W5.2]
MLDLAPQRICTPRSATGLRTIAKNLDQDRDRVWSPWIRSDGRPTRSISLTGGR